MKMQLYLFVMMNIFDDDIVGRFIQFVRFIYGKQTLEENLQFIAVH